MPELETCPYFLSTMLACCWSVEWVALLGSSPIPSHQHLVLRLTGFVACQVCFLPQADHQDIQTKQYTVCSCTKFTLFEWMNEWMKAKLSHNNVSRLRRNAKNYPVEYPALWSHFRPEPDSAGYPACGNRNRISGTSLIRMHRRLAAYTQHVSDQKDLLKIKLMK